MEDDKARKLLDEERTRLEGLSGRMEDPGVDAQEDSLSELSTVDQHAADVGSETFERTKNLALHEDLDGRLEDVARALDKLDSGTYGTCEACEKPIPDERLEAVPAARFCVEHQARQERTVPAE